MGSSVRPRVLELALALGLVWAAGGARAADPCLKQVFGRYCLGGEVAPLAQSSPPPLDQETEGKGLGLVFADDPDRVYVLSYAGRIYKVLRAHRVETQLRFDEIESLLSRKYGPGEDRSRFPADVVTPGQRLAAIRRGEGRVLRIWRPAPDWHIELSWTREMGLALAYLADAIAAQRSADLSQGL
jgi:hypothetical protein